MIFQASHHHHQTPGSTPDTSALSSITHIPQHSNLTSPPPSLSWVDHHPSSISSTSHTADFAAASASVAHAHYNNNMMLADIHHSASSVGYHQPLGSPASSTGSAYPLHNGTTSSNVPTLQPHMVSRKS